MISVLWLDNTHIQVSVHTELIPVVFTGTSSITHYIDKTHLHVTVW